MSGQEIVPSLDRKEAVQIAADYGEGPGWLTKATSAAELAQAQAPSMDRLGMLGLTILDIRSAALRSALDITNRESE